METLETLMKIVFSLIVVTLVISLFLYVFVRMLIGDVSDDDVKAWTQTRNSHNYTIEVDYEPREHFTNEYTIEGNMIYFTDSKGDTKIVPLSQILQITKRHNE